jgi:alkyl hydroperoxide reductase subunit F
VLKARSIIIATGAKWRNMNVPGEDQYRTKGVTYCPHCDGPLFKGKRVAVIGGGNSGVEAAIDLAGIVEHVTLLEFAPEMKADQVLQNKLRSLKNVDIILNAQTTEVKGDGSKVTGLEYRDRVSGMFTMWNWPVSLYRLVCCRTPTGWKAPLNVIAWVKSSSMPSAKPA